MTRSDLPDVNVWLALSVPNHPHHSEAARYWQKTLEGFNANRALGDSASTPKICFCRHTALGLVRLIVQPKVVGNDALSLEQAWQVYRQFRALNEVGFVGEADSGEALDGAIERLLNEQSQPAAHWTDLSLAALAATSGLRMVSFDKDFKRFGLKHLLLL
jgi:uncharacterized protein